jgi:hypothetical protein
MLRSRSFTSFPVMGGYVASSPGNGLIIPADGLMETGEPGSVIPYPLGMRTMFRKIALCAMLVLILAPAAVMAAGQQGQAQGVGNQAGNGLQVQQEIASETMAQEKFQYGQGQGVKSASQNGDASMVQTRSCDQTCDQDQARIQNMTRDQVRLNADSAPANENQGAGSNGDTSMLQTRTRDQTYEQDQARIQNMTRDQVRLGSDSVQQQDGLADSVQSRFGLTKGNGQNILTSFADQLGARFRHAMELFPTPAQ